MVRERGGRKQSKRRICRIKRARGGRGVATNLIHSELPHARQGEERDPQPPKPIGGPMEVAEEVLWFVDEHDALPRVGVAGREDADDDVHGLYVDLALRHQPAYDVEPDAGKAEPEPYLLGRLILDGAPVRTPACARARARIRDQRAQCPPSPLFDAHLPYGG